MIYYIDYKKIHKKRSFLWSHKNGAAITSIVIYVTAFLLITSIVGIITTYFHNNMISVDSNVSSSSNYNKLNIYLLNQTKSKGVSIESYTEDSNLYLNSDGIILEEEELTGNIEDYEKVQYITFELQDGTKNTFVKLKDILYFNKSKLCDNVEDFDIALEEKKKKKILKVKVQLSNMQYSTEYVLNN